MLRGGALPEVTGPAGSVLWLWLNGLFTSKQELLYNVKVLGGAPDIDPAGDELRKTVYSYENLYKAWRILKTCSMEYKDPTGMRFDSTLQLLTDNYVIDAYAYWNIDKLNRATWLAKQTTIKATNTASGADVISRPLCRPPPDGTPLALFDEYKSNDDLIEKEAAQRKTISDLTSKLMATESQLERFKAMVAGHPAALEKHANEKITASMQTFQAQFVALQMQLAHTTKVRDENLKMFETTMKTERMNNDAAIKTLETRITDLQSAHADKIREIQAGLRAQVRKADEDNERSVKDLQKAALAEKERQRRDLKAEFDRTLARHAEDVATCNKQLSAISMQSKQDLAAVKKESEDILERSKEEVQTCKKTLQRVTEQFEKEKNALMKANAETIERLMKANAETLERQVAQVKLQSKQDIDAMKRETSSVVERANGEVQMCKQTLEKQVAQVKLQSKQDVDAVKMETAGMVEKANGEVQTCKQTLQRYTELFEREKSILMKMNAETRDTSVRQMQDIVTRFDEMGDRSCSIM